MNAQQFLLTLCAALLALTGVVHSVKGQRRLIAPLLTENIGILSVPLARFLIPFAWHMTSAVALVLAAIILSWAWAPDMAQTIGLAATGVVFAALGLYDAVGSRGRHIGWPMLTAIGLMAFAALGLAAL